MTLLKFTKNISCDDCTKCSQDISSKLEKYLKTNLVATTSTDKISGHLSCDHKQGKHTIWLFLYSKSGKHEGEKTDKQQFKKGIIKKIPKITSNNRVTKYTGEIPTVEQIKKLI